MQPASITVGCLSHDPVLAFAARDVVRYLGLMTGCPVRLTRALHMADIRIGLISELAGEWPEAVLNGADPSRDQIAILAGAGRAILAGSNPRSALFAAYRWLEALGCRWLKPGSHGERIPRVADPLRVPVSCVETASYSHRCICIEGSCSREHVTNLIDYAAKRGFNAYFLQFRTSYTFFEHWYGLEKNRSPLRTTFTKAQAGVIHAAVKREALRRGMILHMVGHGWTCEPFGVEGLEWGKHGAPVPEKARRCFAEVKGVRELWGGIALNTQLCYANPAVRSIMADDVVRYAGRHPDEAIVHVWLADGSNNFCECAACRKQRHSEWYVQLLNEIDRKLTARRLATRIVFLAYVDLLWAPVRARIQNPDRFILMFAPITRSYAEPFASAGRHVKERLAPFRVNRLTFPVTPAGNVRLFRGWRRAFRGEQVDFDYHLWRAWMADPGQMALGRVLHADIRSLRDLDMDGLISCQAQRVAFPTGWYQHVMGTTLWNRAADPDRMAVAYFRDCYGPGASAVRAYLETLSRLFDPPYIRGEQRSPERLRRVLRQWRRIPVVIHRFKPRILAGRRNRDPVTASAWRMLDHHAWYCTALADLYERIGRRDPSASRAYRRFAHELDRRLPEVHEVLDTWMIKGYVQHALYQAGLPFEEHVTVAPRKKASVSNR